MSTYEDVIIAGFGGQGVMLAGNLLAYSAMLEGLNVTFIPVYGPEMRGGTANCTVVLSDEEIGSPIIHRPMSLIAMNLPSLDKFQPKTQKGGKVILNSSLVDPSLGDREKCEIYPVPVNDIADKLGNTKMANMAALGAYAEATGTISLEAIKRGFDHVLPSHYHHLIPKNTEALEAGAAFVREKGHA